MLVRRCFPDAPLKYMPPTKHKETDIFFSHAYDVMADLVAIWTRQGIQLLGMMTEAMHTPLLGGPLRGAQVRPRTSTARRAASTRSSPCARTGRSPTARARSSARRMELLEECQQDGLVAAIGRGRFGDVKRARDRRQGPGRRAGEGAGLLQPVPGDSGGAHDRLVSCWRWRSSAGRLGGCAGEAPGQDADAPGPGAWKRPTTEGTEKFGALRRRVVRAGRGRRADGRHEPKVCLDKILTAMGGARAGRSSAWAAHPRRRR